MNAIAKAGHQALAVPEEEALRVLGNSLYPGARPESIRLVLAWCRATGRDPMKKPIHVVPMWVEDKTTGKGEMRDVLMPGIVTYRTDAAATGQYAGKSEPEYGPDVTSKLGATSLTYPKWCKVTVQRIVAGQVRSFTAMEFWLENYATAGRGKTEPNAMWLRRPYAQLAKCTESQALRMAFPDETGNTNTADEMEGKTFEGTTLDGEVDAAAQFVQERTRISPPSGSADKIIAAKVPKRTYRQLVDEVRQKLAGFTDRDDVVALADEPHVKYAIEHANAEVRQELSDLLADAYGRFAEQEEDAGPPDDDTFPGDRP